MITEIATKLVSPVINMVLARVLVPEAFGVVATVNMITSFADIFTDAGFQKYLVQRDFNSKEELDKSTNVAFWSNLVLSATIWVIICLFSETLAGLVGNTSLKNVISISSFSLILTAFSSIQMARFKRDFNYKALFYMRLITIFVPFFVTLPLALVLRNYWALIIGTLVNNLISAVILTYKSQWKPGFYFSFSKLISMFSYSWWILLESISVWLTSYVGVFIVGRVLSDYYLGLYQTSMATVNQIVALITSATSMPLFAAMSRLKDDDNKFNETYRKYVQAVGVFVIPLGFGIWLYRDFVTLVLLGNQWMDASEFIGLWGLTSSLTLVLGTYCNGYFNAKGKTYLSFLSQLLQLIVLIPTISMCVNYGYDTLCRGRALIRLEIIMVELVIMFVAFRFPVWKLFTDLIPSLVSTAIMTFISVFIQNSFDFILWKVICIVICIFVYFVSLLLISKKTLLSGLAVLGIKK